MKPEVSTWQSAPAGPQPDRNDLHVWRFCIDICADSGKLFRHSLSSDELVRADRFIQSLHQSRFIAARYGLRCILARYLKCVPASVTFACHQRGKPFLGQQHQANLSFNLSHSGDWAVLAVTARGNVGVDIEKIAVNDNLQQLGDFAFDETEKKLFAGFSPARKVRGFYRLWTKKESRLKMLGTGLGDIKRYVTPAFERFFVPAKGYVGAVAADTEVHRIIRYHLTLA